MKAKVKVKPGPQKPIKIPWFNRKQIGLGDIVEKVTNAVGVAPCSRCLKRKIILNRIQIGGKTEEEFP